MSPPAQATTSAPSNGPMPGMLGITSASRCSWQRAAICASTAAISSSSARTDRASVFTTAAAVLSNGRGGVLGLCRGDGCIGHGLSAADFAVLQPGREPTRADPAEAGWGPIAGQQDECGFGRRSRRSVPGREVLQELGTHPIDGAGPVGGEVMTAGGLYLQVHRNLVPLLQGLQVPAHPCLVGDDVGVLCIGLAVPAVATGSVMDGSARQGCRAVAVRGWSGGRSAERPRRRSDRRPT